MRTGATSPKRASPPDRYRPKISVTVNPTLLEWIRKNTGTGRFFKSTSDAFEWCLNDVRKRRGEHMKLE
jgi:hypothetical protein